MSRQLKVLLVEDSEEDIFFFRRALAKTGVAAEVTVVRDGKAAIEAIQHSEQDYTIVFLDLKLPKLSGFDVMEQLPANKRVRIVVLSGSAHEKDKARASESGVTDYVVKPIDPEVLHSYLAPLAKS